MNDKSIVIINTINKNTHTIGTSDVLVKHQHGNVLVRASDNMSFGFVFRVVEHSHKYNQINNVMLPRIENNTRKEEETN